MAEDAEELEEERSYLLDDCLDAMYTDWEDSASGFNSGQQSIYGQYIMPALDDIAESIAGDWPWINVDSYYTAPVSEAFDPEVMERAFSESIVNPVPDMEEIVAEAKGLQIVADVIDFLDGIDPGDFEG